MALDAMTASFQKIGSKRKVLTNTLPSLSLAVTRLKGESEHG
jgi:hypothetical protein